MPHPQYPLAVDTLESAFLSPGQVQSAPAACPHCLDDLDGAMIVVREVEDGETIDTLVADRGHGYGPTVLDCEGCDRALVADIVVLRDRQRRCVRALAEVA